MNAAEKMVSVGAPVCNEERFIRRSIESLLSQTYGNMEIIVSDNGSTDGTWDIISEYARSDSRIRPIRQEKNIGSDNNFMYVLAQARGAYFFWAGGDDWWDKRYVETLVKKLEDNPDRAVAQCSVTRVFDDGQVKNIIMFDGALDMNGKSRDDVFRMMIHDVHIHHFICGLFKTGELRKIARRGMPPCARGDRVFMCEAAMAMSFCSVPDTLYKKTLFRKSRAERYSGIDKSLSSAWENPKHHTRYLLNMIWRLMSSRAVPARRKWLALSEWMKLLWNTRGLVLEELFPSFFKRN